MATLPIEIADADEGTVIAALAFNAGYRDSEQDGDQKEFAINSLIEYIKAVTHAVAINEIRITTEAAVAQATADLKEIEISNPEAVLKVNPVDVVSEPVV